MFTVADYGRLVEVLVRLRADPDNEEVERELARLQEKFAVDPAEYQASIDDIHERLDRGERYYGPERDWVPAAEQPPRGPIPHTSLKPAIGLARAYLIVALKREPERLEIARRILEDPELRIIGEVGPTVDARSLLRRWQREDEHNHR